MSLPSIWHASGIVLFHPPTKSVLLLKRSRDGYWGIPGGKPNAGENPFQTARRETFEETGFLVNSPLFYIGNNAGFLVLSKVVTDQPAPKLTPEHTTFSWASLSDLPGPLYPGFLPVLNRIQH